MTPKSNTVGSTPYYQVLYNFTRSPDGANPTASLVDVNGVLYGTTQNGGVYRTHYGNTFGTIFRVARSGKESVLHSFGSGTDGSHPGASMIEVNGVLYGTTETGGITGSGTIFTSTTSGKEKVLYSFHGADGAGPFASLLNVKGTLYGTTRQGGAYSCGHDFRCGVVFSITTGGAEKVLHSFGALTKGTHPDGRFPQASLLDVNGALYGTTSAGGGPGSSSGSAGCNHGCGTVFRLTTGGAERVLHVFTFPYGNDGGLPWGGLTDVNGTLYGTTLWGGPGGEEGGTVFSITPSGKEKILHSFEGNPDGEEPQGNLLDVNGTLYGTTELGGTYGDGTVFSITPSGKEKILHSFGSASDGTDPLAGLIDVDGTLYGTTAAGGTGCGGSGCGTVFALTP